MNTFLPYPCFACSAKVLDRKRLGKQRVEAKQILTTLMGLSQSWKFHPIMTMWKGYNEALVTYGKVICKEWIDRGYKDNLLPYFELFDDEPYVKPLWLGDRQLHRSHRSNLLRKDVIHYGQFGWTEEENIPYYWPDEKYKPLHNRESHYCEMNHVRSS